MENQNREGGGLRDELKEDTGRVTGAAADRLQSEADKRKGEVAGQAHAVSSALDSAARELGQDSPSWIKSALEQGARSVEQLAQTVEGKDSRQLAGDVQQFARQRPGSFLAGCALLGFAASRVFKAGGSQGSQSSSGNTTPRSTSTPVYDPYEPETARGARPMMDFGTAAGASPGSAPNPTATVPTATGATATGRTTTGSTSTTPSGIGGGNRTGG
ncbi:hypothetical protein ABVV53_00660 [Novosphingobium sp. RD2P27]|uniref:DUF3618 domain-containing protein n=1 Tax=Novosphingobium kalidii TaxID=3230299 RepID=A0ABV2CWK2_9SPHN